MQRSLSVVMVEDDPDHVWLLTSCLSRDDSYEIVGHADTADDAVRVVEDCQPDIVLLDLHLRQSSGTTSIPGIMMGATMEPKIANDTNAAMTTGARLHGTVDGDDVTLAKRRPWRVRPHGRGQRCPGLHRTILTGGDADEYTLPQPPSLTGNIVPAATMSTGTTTDNKPDGASEGDCPTATRCTPATGC